MKPGARVPLPATRQARPSRLRVQDSECGVCAGREKILDMTMSSSNYSFNQTKIPSVFAGKAWQQVLSRDAKRRWPVRVCGQDDEGFLPAELRQPPARTQERYILSDSGAGSRGGLSRLPALRAGERCAKGRSAGRGDSGGRQLPDRAFAAERTKLKDLSDRYRSRSADDSARLQTCAWRDSAGVCEGAARREI